MSTRRKAPKMKILLPVDNSPCSARAVQAVTERPWPRGTTVRVLSAVEIPGAPPLGTPLMFDAQGDFEQIQQQRTEQANKLTERVAHSLAASGLATEAVVHDGDPRSVIV